MIARGIGVFLAGLVLASCVTLLPEAPPPPRLYPLEAAQAAESPAPRGALVLAVMEPTGPALLLGDAIVWRENGALGVMSGGAWADNAARLLQGLVAQTASAEQGLAGAVRAGAGARADVALMWDIRQFEIVEEPGVLEARFAARASIVDLRTRRLIASEDVRAAQALSQRSGAVAAAALAQTARAGAARMSAMAAEVAAQRAAETPPAQ